MTPTLAWTFQPDERAPALLRHDLREYYDEVCPRLDSDAVATALLLLTELVTNAIQHGCGQVGVCITNHDDRLRVSISDDRPTLPRMQPMDVESDHGRGMQLVDLMSASWGVVPATPPDTGKAVWFEVA